VGRMRGGAAHCCDRGVPLRGRKGAAARTGQVNSAASPRVGTWSILTSGTSIPTPLRVSLRGSDLVRPGGWPLARPMMAAPLGFDRRGKGGWTQRPRPRLWGLPQGL
jgi:hypothetical protein